MSRTALAVAVAVFFGGAASDARADIIYDAAADFSQAQNPNSVWRYGQSTTLASAFTLYTGTVREFSQIESWNAGSGVFANPSVSYNPSASSVTVATITFGPQQLALHPGEQGQFSVVRFVAPAAGNYSLNSSFAGLDFTGPTTTDVHVLLNNASIFSGAVSAFGSGPSFATNLTLAAGDTIDFKVGVGANGNYFYDTTALNARLTLRETAAVPGPSGLALFGAVALAGLGCRRRQGVRHG